VHLNTDPSGDVHGFQGVAGKYKRKGGDLDAIARVQGDAPGQPLAIDESAIGAA
jgi:hypothetical protein